MELLLVHPGGPFWARKDAGAWSVPKGEYDISEDALHAACREFREETGFDVSDLPVPLGSSVQKSGKVVSVWAIEGTCDASAVRSNTCQMEWPRGSGKWVEFPEVDRAAWFSVDEARAKLNTGQVPFVEALCELLASGSPEIE